MASYQNLFELARDNAKKAGIDADFVECAWGDPLGSEFRGLSLPSIPDGEVLRQRSEDYARWSWLYTDPLSELEKLTIRDPSQAKPRLRPDVKPKWLETWDEVRAYQPSPEMRLLLERGGIDDAVWVSAWQSVVNGNELTKEAFKHSEHELPEALQALARAVVAQVYRELLVSDHAGLNRNIRDKMVERLSADWNATVLSPGSFLTKMITRVATNVIKQKRFGLSASMAPMIGDILLYQSNGAAIREFIRSKILAAEGPVTVVAHSLGGIASVDLLAFADAPKVERLITVGSQAPLLYEIGALASLRPGQNLPPEFPAWLNIYDQNDMLSYVGERLFPTIRDMEVESAQPFPDAHSAYFNNDAVWDGIGDFLKSA